jgi:hypothetical protein
MFWRSVGPDRLTLASTLKTFIAHSSNTCTRTALSRHSLMAVSWPSQKRAQAAFRVLDTFTNEPNLWRLSPSAVKVRGAPQQLNLISTSEGLYRLPTTLMSPQTSRRGLSPTP